MIVGDRIGNQDQVKWRSHRGLSRNAMKNYSKGPCVTILE